MNILKPELSWIEGRCYRLNDASADNMATFQEHDLYESDDYQNRKESDNEDDEVEEIVVEQKDESRYRASFHISRHYLGSVIGRKGATRQRIEHDTKTEIKIPRQGQHGDVVILGTNPANVKAARRRINMIVVSSRLKQRVTHFISLPMNNKNIVENYKIFKETILRDYLDSGVEESIFIPEMRLHITSGVMCLMDNEERQQVSQLLTEAKDKVIMYSGGLMELYLCCLWFTLITIAIRVNHRQQRPLIKDYLPLTLRLQGISYMNDDPKNIHILYGNVSEENAPDGVLQRLVDSIVQYFYAAGFMAKNEYGGESVKLHVTLMNSRYRTADQTPNQTSSRRVPFDGSRILEKFADYDFGTAQLTDIHLSQMHAYGDDGYYQQTCTTCAPRPTTPAVAGGSLAPTPSGARLQHLTPNVTSNTPVLIIIVLFGCVEKRRMTLVRFGHCRLGFIKPSPTART